MNRTLVTVLATLVAVLVLALAGTAVMVFGGLYDIGASTQHLQPVYSLLETTMGHAVRRRAAAIEVPAPAGPSAALRGAACYRDLCVQCHGGPGVRPGAAVRRTGSVRQRSWCGTSPSPFAIPLSPPAHPARE